MQVEIDKYAGFCFGVIKAINAAEELLNKSEDFYCLGQIVHNAKEETRLKNLGMKTLNNIKKLKSIKNKTILIRAHGEPPKTYIQALENNIKIIDATCPIVIKLQKKIKHAYDNNPNADIIIFGKEGHPEVNGLVGQTNNTAIVIGNVDDLSKIDLKQNIFIFSQTTSDYDKYQKIISTLENILTQKYDKNYNLKVYQTICPSVKNRIPRLKEFCKKHDLIIFVSDPNSSNGKMLFEICVSEKSDKVHFIKSPDDISPNWFNSINSVGISGATSTPLWLMEEVKSRIFEIVDRFKYIK